MPIVPIPPVAAVTIRLDGLPVRAYAAAFVINGHTYAPIAPYLTDISQRVSNEHGALVVERDEHTVRIRIRSLFPDALDRVYVEIAPLLRSLGENVVYDPSTRTVDVSTPQPYVVESPTPFDATAMTPAPSAVFTPTPMPTPAPVWSGTPLPRRTPLPYPIPT